MMVGKIDYKVNNFQLSTAFFQGNRIKIVSFILQPAFSVPLKTKNE
jgi:hypothetical protein